jgi:hypothetical protein
LSLGKFIATVYLLVSAGKWAELAEYFALIRELLKPQPQPQVILTPGTPRDKEKK